MKLEKFITNNEVIFRSGRTTLFIKIEVIQDAKISGYDLLDEEFIKSLFLNK